MSECAEGKFTSFYHDRLMRFDAELVFDLRESLENMAATIRDVLGV
ncbi:hypothetical protein ACIBJI_26895 [Nocardia sp. NPDC050408]